jgi:hypothetical protein
MSGSVTLFTQACQPTDDAAFGTLLIDLFLSQL